MLHSQIFGKGTPLLVLHGFLGMSDNWKSFAKKWSEDYQVHLIDQRNHGRSFHSNNFSYSLMSEDLKQYIDHHQLNKSILLGHSMGGKTAMTFATQRPNRVSHLIVADIAPKKYPIHHQMIINGLLSLDFDQLKTRKAVDSKLSEFVPEVSTRQFLLKNLFWKTPNQLGLRINLSSLANSLHLIGEALNKNAFFEGSTLFLDGEQSNYILPEDYLYIKNHFPQATIQVVPKAGHWLHAQNPKEFLKLVDQFLNF